MLQWINININQISKTKQNRLFDFCISEYKNKMEAPAAPPSLCQLSSCIPFHYHEEKESLVCNGQSVKPIQT